MSRRIATGVLAIDHVQSSVEPTVAAIWLLTVNNHQQGVCHNSVRALRVSFRQSHLQFGGLSPGTVSGSHG
ncbi:MAG: hypothetical protein MUF54_25120 [Polyangiaceae bacterium]|jgi:hypothetical protein|nr:hypothetical protein [Polyangiaceae bacterium]